VWPAFSLAPSGRDFVTIDFRKLAMHKQREASIKPGQAALIITYGNTKQKQRPLDGDLVVLGHSPTCDISLISPEVAPVHCILQRTSDGWYLRDCSGGRHATRLNGRPVREEKLHDADVFQIGAFSFEVRLPLAHPTPHPGTTPVVDDRLAARIKYLQRSRQNLVRLALRLRRKARQANPLPPTLAELEQQAESLRGLQRDYQTLIAEYESRVNDLEQAEREVCDARVAFERECTERQERLDDAEKQLARRQEETEAQIKQCWDEFQQRCRQAEQRHAQWLQALPAEDAAAFASRELAGMLDQRSQELNHFARYLRRSRQQLVEQLAHERAAIAKERHELLRFHEEIRTAGLGRSASRRLAKLSSIRRAIAGTSPSAPGQELRSQPEINLMDLERSSVG
jgi:pSer/pThr/pTyr-binding forkhead associated (FHA) protein